VSSLENYVDIINYRDFSQFKVQYQFFLFAFLDLCAPFQVAGVDIVQLCVATIGFSRTVSAAFISIFDVQIAKSVEQELL
jgi:hypothetical protein